MVAPQESPSVTLLTLRVPNEPAAIELKIRGRIDRADAARLGRHVRNLVDGGDITEIVCDVGALTNSDVAVVDALCRMRLAARRRGCQLKLRGASARLLDLVFLVGLGDALPVASRSELGTEGQPEEREHPGRIEEERDPADPAV